MNPNGLPELEFSDAYWRDPHTTLAALVDGMRRQANAFSARPEVVAAMLPWLAWAYEETLAAQTEAA